MSVNIVTIEEFKEEIKTEDSMPLVTEDQDAGSDCLRYRSGRSYYCR